MAGIVDLGHGRVLAVQAVAYTGSSAQATNPFGTETWQVRLCSNSACHYKVGNGTLAATTNDTFLPANWVEYVMVSPGQSIAAIESSTAGLVTATAGSLWVTELG